MWSVTRPGVVLYVLTLLAQYMDLDPAREAEAEPRLDLSVALTRPHLGGLLSLSVLLTLIPSGHFAAEDVKAKLSELNQKWEALKAKASQRRQDLEDSLQAQQYFADANEAESWMREKEPIVGSTDYGKDEDSAEVSQT